MNVNMVFLKKRRDLPVIKKESKANYNANKTSQEVHV